MTFAGRRLLSGAILVIVSALLIFGHAAYAATLGHERFLSGWLLLGLVLFLALYNLRRRVPFLPLGTSSSWLQLHVLAGALSLVVFALHIGGIPPDGAFERWLAATFLVVAASGLVGLFLSRVLPGRLSSRGENLLYERIPIIRRQLLERAEELVIAATAETQSTTIADYYADRLRGFFDGPRNFWSHLVESGRPRRRMLNEMDDLSRYLDEREQELLDELRGLALAKDEVDYQQALQGVLRRWSFVHVPFTLMLLLLAAVHLVLVHAFG